MRFVALDSWRGVCALAVALFHFPILGLVVSSTIVRNSYMFVDFFFVLSGFVIASVYAGRLDTFVQRRTFIIRRFGRLWPLHVTMLAVFVLASAVKGEIGIDERHSVAAIFTNLALIHGLGVHHDLTWNDPSWSISVEFFLYLIFVALSAAPWRLVAYVALVAGGIAMLAFWAPRGSDSTFDFGLYRGLAGFFTGAIVARLPRRTLGGVAETAMVVAVIAFMSFSQVKLFAPLVFAATVYVFAGSTGWISRGLSLPPIVKLGEWSYSIYMVHAAVVAGVWWVARRLELTRAGDMLVAPPFWRDIAPFIYLGVVVVISMVTYRFVETPGRTFFNKLAQRRKLAMAAA